MIAILGVIKHSDTSRIFTLIGVIASIVSILIAIVFSFIKFYWNSFEVVYTTNYWIIYNCNTNILTRFVSEYHTNTHT